MTSSIRSISAKCPRCGSPHQYREVKFDAINDPGYWKLPCNGCNVPFVIKLLNAESSGASYYVPEKHDGSYPGPMEDVSTEIAVHNLEPDKVEHRFNYAARPIYVCERKQTNLEGAARDALAAAFGDVKSVYENAINVALALRGPDAHVDRSLHTVFRVQVSEFGQAPA